MADIFVSYISDDRDGAFWIDQELGKLGHTPRIQHPARNPVMGSLPSPLRAMSHKLVRAVFL